MTARISAIFRALVMLASIFSASTSLAAPPSTPSACEAITSLNTGGTTATISISWLDNSTNETQWQIQVSVNNGPYSVLGTVASSTTAAAGVDAGITWGAAAINTTYRFLVLASNGTEVSAPSNVATVGTYEINSPFNLKVTSVDPFNVMMTWEESSTTETGFGIEMKAGTGNWQYLGFVGTNTLGVGPIYLTEPATSYQFRIRAFRGGAPSTPDSSAGTSAVSPYSTIIPVLTAAYPLTAVPLPGQKQVDLTWNNVLNEDGYLIYVLNPGAVQYQQLASTARDATTYRANLSSAGNHSFIVVPYYGNGNFMGESSIATAIVDGITSKTGTSGTPGATLSHTFTHASAASVVSRTLTGAPSGVTFDPATGTLGGIVPAPGNYPLTYTVNLSNGAALTQMFHLRVRPAPGPPQIASEIPDWSTPAGSSRSTPLAGIFTDPEAESAVRVTTTLGVMDFILFDSATPATVANFMNYVNAGKYSNVAFHRSVPGFVIQGGGFKGAGTGSNFTSVVTDPPVVNEPGIANLRGTVSMAKLGGNPDSATSQFFVSVADNTANLDYQNGGFTVFGRVAGNGMAVADAINTLPNGTYNLLLDGNTTAVPFDNFPMNDPVLPNPMDQTKLVNILSVNPVPTLSLAVTGNTDPTVATATISNGELHLTSLRGGRTTVTLTATDLDQLTNTQTIEVTVHDTYATWAARQNLPENSAAPGDNPDADQAPNLVEFALLGNPLSSTSNPQPLTATTGTPPDPAYLTLSFPVRKATLGLTYAVEATTDPGGTWSPVWTSADGFSHPQVTSAIEGAESTTVTIKDSEPTTAHARRFLRLKVTTN